MLIFIFFPPSLFKPGSLLCRLKACTALWSVFISLLLFSIYIYIYTYMKKVIFLSQILLLVYWKMAKYTFSFAVEWQEKEKHLWVDNIVCRVAIDLQTPADMFHFLCSRCASLILRVRSDITRATWVDDWWCPLVNIASYMCHRPKEPTSSTSSLFIFLFIFLLPPSFSTRSIFSFSFSPPPLALPFPSILLTVVFQSCGFAVKRGMRPSLFLCACTLFFFFPCKVEGAENIEH